MESGALLLVPESFPRIAPLRSFIRARRFPSVVQALGQHLPECAGLRGFGRSPTFEHAEREIWKRGWAPGGLGVALWATEA